DEEQLGHDSVIEPHERQAEAHQRVDGAQAKCECRLKAPLKPQAQAIKTPGSRPAEQRAKDEAVEQAASRTKARAVVVPGEEAHAARAGGVLRVAGAVADERPGVGGADVQGGGAAALRVGG